MTNAPKIIDAHNHLTFIPKTSRQDYLSKLESLGVSELWLAGYDPEDWTEQLNFEVANKVRIRRCFGIHPWNFQSKSEIEIARDWDFLMSIIHRADLIGETGLDHFKQHTPVSREIELQYFRMHLDLAKERALPVILHIVQAHELALKGLKSVALQRGGIVHGFSGSYEIAKKYLDLGFLISLGPNLLKNRYKQLKDVAKRLSDQQFVIETDAPQSRGEAPDPELILEVAKALSSIRSQSLEKIIVHATTNAKSLFKSP